MLQGKLPSHTAKIAFDALLNLLEKARMLKCDANNSMVNVSLLPLAISCSKNLQQQWQAQLKHDDSVPITFMTNCENITTKRPTAFDQIVIPTSTELLQEIDHLQQRTNSTLQCPTAIAKILETTLEKHDNHSDRLLSANDDICCNLRHRNATHLITDYFFAPWLGREKFYFVQRQRKIWWMRFSANPSRYLLEPLKLPAAVPSDQYALNGSAVGVKVDLGFGSAVVEHLTLSPGEAATDNSLTMLDPRTGKRVRPAVLRSVINLQTATGALLLDAADPKRGVLNINRKLAPYQIAVICAEEGKLELSELCDHLTYSIADTTLRVYEYGTNTSSKPTCAEQLRMADRLGVPHTIIVEAASLSTGFLKLRSRDTTLMESVHITDLIPYLNQIYV